MNIDIASFCFGLAIGCVIALIVVQLVSNAYEKSIPAIRELALRHSDRKEQSDGSIKTQQVDRS